MAYLLPYRSQAVTSRPGRRRRETWPERSDGAVRRSDVGSWTPAAPPLRRSAAG